eukprot:TRINITY_DN1921_c0_g1_i1.p1 TRINITY_DN1921_c0_g1~~TRINITY_DN1921_c0_g1_i1.p1  ORF type:complete len:344 (-),score=95.38 TRINITY_DN1921_c0_g1_i1:43-1074(-)
MPYRSANNHKRLFPVLFTYQNYGVGQKFTRAIWKRPDCYWTITKVEPTCQAFHNKPNGKVWGVLTWRGIPDIGPRKIRGAAKSQWMPYKPEYYEQFKDETRWIQNQHLIGGSVPLPVVVQDPTKIPILEQRYKTVSAYDPGFEIAAQMEKDPDQRLLFKTSDTNLEFHFPHLKPGKKYPQPKIGQDPKSYEDPLLARIREAEESLETAVEIRMKEELDLVAAKERYARIVAKVGKLNAKTFEKRRARRIRMNEEKERRKQMESEEGEEGEGNLAMEANADGEPKDQSEQTQESTSSTTESFITPLDLNQPEETEKKTSKEKSLKDQVDPVKSATSNQPLSQNI